MAEMNEVVKLAVDAHNGNVEKYSARQASDVLRQALIEANGGDTKIDYRKIRDGKCSGVFALVEEILASTVAEGLQGDEFFNALVDFRNVALGDKNLFLVEDSNLFVVDDSADGTQGIRRQRLGGASETSIPTSTKSVRIYEELNRVLSGRSDFNYMIDRVSESFRQAILNDIYGLWTSATKTQMGGDTYFPDAGSYDEDALLDLISHVEAAAGGRQATIIGTKKAVRNLKESVQSDLAREELHNLGYYGKFFGTPVVVVPQRHKVGTTDFVMDDNVLTVIAGDDKPIKVVYEGDPLVIVHEPRENADLTMEYFYAEKWGAGIVLAGGNAGIGRYEISD